MDFWEYFYTRKPGDEVAFIISGEIIRGKALVIPNRGDTYMDIKTDYRTVISIDLNTVQAIVQSEDSYYGKSPENATITSQPDAGSISQ